MSLDYFADGADISPCGRYRYALWRDLPNGHRDADGAVTFIMLNPSTADAVANDPTIRRCMRFAQSWGRRQLRVVNLFALRSTNPRALLDAENPIGDPDNRVAILKACRNALIVCAWGRWGEIWARGHNLRQQLTGKGFLLHHLGLTKSGQPLHPLYLPGNSKPIEWKEATSI